MLHKRSWLPFVMLVLSAHALLAQTLTFKKDLRGEWLHHDKGTYKPWQAGDKTKALYFTLDADKLSSDYLRIANAHTVNLMINNQLTFTGKSGVFSVDSLANRFGPSVLTVAIFQEDGNLEGLSTVLMTKRSLAEVVKSPILRETYFRDFAIFGLVLLSAFLVVVVRLNPRLASDYLSIAKVFSLRELDDNQINSRISNSTNILFYILCSLIIGYYLLILFQFVSLSYPVAFAYQPASFGDALWIWLKISTTILGVFILKIFLVYGLTNLFGVTDAAGVHFFNWIRLLLIVFGILTLILSTYFILHGFNESVYGFFFRVTGWILVAWMILILFKLSGLLKGSMFHLFSYICATELIPFLITIKVLFN